MTWGLLKNQWTLEFIVPIKYAICLLEFWQMPYQISPVYKCLKPYPAYFANIKAFSACLYLQYV